MRKTLLTHASVEFAELTDLTEPDKLEYCRKWGLDYVRVLTPEVNCWHRPMMWLQQLLNCDLMLFMGADTMITNLHRDPCLLLDGKLDLVIAADGNGINCDVFLMRRTKATLAFLRQVIADGPKIAGNEQKAMSIFLSGAQNYPEFKARIGLPLRGGGVTSSRELRKRIQAQYDAGPYDLKTAVVGQRALNAYPQNFYGRPASIGYGWQPDDFIAHFPGLPLAERVRGIKLLLPQVKR
jgi:hypothetical protein